MVFLGSNTDTWMIMEPIPKQESILGQVSFRSLMPWSGRSHMELKMKANLLNFHPGLEK